LGIGDRLPAIARFGNYEHIGTSPEKCDQTLPYNMMIFDHQYANWFH
jgi:hypothetical protein